MEWWLNVSWVDVDHLQPIAQEAERLGFGGLSMGDHLLYPGEIASRYPYMPDGKPNWTGQTHWPDNWVAIMAMAAVTTRLKFNTGVYIAPLRDPVSMAKSLSTLSRLSGNRVLPGFGAGWMKEEFDIVGQRFDARGARMDEQIEVMRLLWSGEMVDYKGRFYEFPPVQMSPAPLEPIPVYIGGLNDAALRRAARNDGWVGVHYGFDRTAELIGQIRAYEKDFDKRTPCRMFMDVHGFEPGDTERYAELGVEFACMPLPTTPGKPGLDGKLEAMARCADQLGLQV